MNIILFQSYAVHLTFKIKYIHMKKLVLLSLITLALLFSCKKDPAPVVKNVTDAMARDTLYYIMKEWYFWYNVMPEVTKENYSDPYKLLDAMRYKDPRQMELCC